MGSSTRCCAKPLDPLRRRLLFALGALPLDALGLLTNDGTAVADAASRARLWRDGEGNWFLDADLGFERFPAVWEDLLQRGIAMPLRLELMLYRERWYWSDQLVFGKFWRITIRHQPVTQDWLLTVGDATHVFYDRETLLQSLRSIRGWPVAADVFNPLSDVRAELRLSVDLSQLPQTLRASALGNDAYAWEVGPYRWYPWRKR